MAHVEVDDERSPKEPHPGERTRERQLRRRIGPDGLTTRRRKEDVARSDLLALAGAPEGTSEPNVATYSAANVDWMRGVHTGPGATAARVERRRTRPVAALRRGFGGAYQRVRAGLRLNLLRNAEPRGGGERCQQDPVLDRSRGSFR